jgi:hypothetical protein
MVSNQYQAKRTITSYLKSVNIEKTMTYDVESSYLVLRQAQSVLGINLLIGTQTSRSFFVYIFRQ